MNRKTTDVVDLAVYSRIGTCRYDEGQMVSRVWWASWEDEAAVLVTTAPGEDHEGTLYHLDREDFPAEGYMMSAEELSKVAYGPRPCQIRDSR